MSLQTARVEFSYGDGTVTIHIKTPDGTATIGPLPSATFWEQQHIGFYEKNPESGPRKVSPKRQKRASIAQEDSIMEALGGRRQKGSGAVAGLKGDGRVRHKYRVEAKYTRAGSYRVERSELNKIRGECAGTEIPLFVIDFVDPQTGGSPDRWVMLEFERFNQLEYKPAHATDHTR